VEIKSVRGTDALCPIINKLSQFSTAVDIFFHNANLKISLFFFEFRTILKCVFFLSAAISRGGKRALYGADFLKTGMA